MFDLDEMKEVLTANDKKLDQSIRLNRELLNAATLSKAHSVTQRMTWALGLKTVVWFAIVSLGSFISHHAGTLRLSLSAAAIDIYAIATIPAASNNIRCFAGQSASARKLGYR